MGASSVIIEELTGQGRRLELRGAGMPFRGANWGTRMRMSTTWYSGNSIQATQQVFGSAELPTNWEGVWNTTRLVSSAAEYKGPEGTQKIARAWVLRDVVESLLSSGARLRVTWATTNQKIVRVGRAAEWDFPHDREDDIRWKVTWDWMGRGGVQQRVVTFKGDDKVAAQKELNFALAALQQVQALGGAAMQSAAGVPLSADSLSLGDLEAFANGPLETMKSIQQAANQINDTIEDLASIAETIATTPAQLATAAIQIATNAINVLNQVDQDLGQSVPEAYTKVGTVSVPQLLKASKTFGNVQTSSQVAVDVALKLAEAARRRQNALTAGRRGDRAKPADMLAVYLTKQDDTFLSISAKFYKTPDHSAEVAKANGFPEYQVSPPVGFPLIVPNLTAIEDLQQA